MKYFLDTEFHEYHKQSKCLGIPIGKPIPTIDLISIGIVSEDIEKTLMPPTDTYNETIKTNREYYAISKDFNIKDAWYSYQLEINKLYPLGSKNNKIYWLRENVLKSIFDELSNKETNRLFTNKNTTFNLKNFTRLINKYGKTNKQIAKEIKEFIGVSNMIKEYEEMYSKYNTTTTIQWKKKIDKLKPEFYAYYGSYDWVVFCQLFGKMIDLPKGFPMYCNDTKQILDTTAKGIDGFTFEQSLQAIKDDPRYPQQYNEHNALDDAKWNKKLYKFLNNL